MSFSNRKRRDLGNIFKYLIGHENKMILWPIKAAEKLKMRKIKANQVG